ncbi:MAG: hypothetical protein JW910_20070 [Anaerolineae bacterium]|nr:hypothetical protein [Anaerolineae bacterium]
MYPEDRVLVGVINRKRDLDHVRYDHWYRIPRDRMDGIHAEYLAFFLSRAFGEQNGAIHYFARRMGHELVLRRDLLPQEANHPRADRTYYKIQLGELREKLPPVRNPTRRVVTFIYTTWDRFVAAGEIADLYSDADHFVERLTHALQRERLSPERVWEAQDTSDDGGAQVRIVCERGEFVATTAETHEERLHLPVELGVEHMEALVAEIRARIAALGGPLTPPIPLEH